MKHILNNKSLTKYIKNKAIKKIALFCDTCVIIDCYICKKYMC